MVSTITFLLILDCMFSLLSIFVAARALAVAKDVPDMPKKLFVLARANEAAVEGLKGTLNGHIKRDAGQTAQANRVKNTTAPSYINPDGTFNYGGLDMALNSEGDNGNG